MATRHRRGSLPTAHLFEEDEELVVRDEWQELPPEEQPPHGAGSLAKNLLFCCTAEAWRTPNSMHIFIAFLLYMLANAFTNATTQLIVIELCNGDVGEASSLNGYLSAAGAAATLFTAASLGLISDRWGRVPCLLISIVGFGIDTAALAAAYVFKWPVWPLYFTRFLGGATSGFYTAGYAYVADISSTQERSKKFGIFGVAMGIGFLFGPILGGVLGEINLAIPLIVAVCLTAINLVYVRFLMVESKQKERTPWDWKRVNPFRSFALLLLNRYALSVAMTFFIMFLAEEGVFSISVLFLKHKFPGLGALDFGLLTACFGVTYVASQGVLIRVLLPRIGDRKALLISMFTDSVASWLYGFVPAIYYIYPLVLLRTISMMAMPVTQGIISKQYGPNQQGELMGVLSGLKTVTGFFGPLIYNQLLSYFMSDDAWPAQNAGLVYVVISLNAAVSFVACCIVFLVFPESKTGYKSETEVIATTDELRPLSVNFSSPPDTGRSEQRDDCAHV